MPVWSKVAAGLVLAGVLIGLVGFRAYSERLGPYVGQYGTTYYNGEGPLSVPVTCKPESEIVTAIQLKSIITQPLSGASLQRGTIVVLGAAYAGEGHVDRVDISIDGGGSWQPASAGWNFLCYGNNGVEEHAVTVTVG